MKVKMMTKMTGKLKKIIRQNTNQKILTGKSPPKTSLSTSKKKARTKTTIRIDNTNNINNNNKIRATTMKRKPKKVHQVSSQSRKNNQNKPILMILSNSNNSSIISIHRQILRRNQEAIHPMLTTSRPASRQQVSLLLKR